MQRAVGDSGVVMVYGGSTEMGGMAAHGVVGVGWSARCAFPAQQQRSRQMKNKQNKNMSALGVAR